MKDNRPKVTSQSKMQESLLGYTTEIKHEKASNQKITF